MAHKPAQTEEHRHGALVFTIKGPCSYPHVNSPTGKHCKPFWWLKESRWAASSMYDSREEALEAIKRHPGVGP